MTTEALEELSIARTPPPGSFAASPAQRWPRATEAAVG
jgi:hypothetical protein